MFYTDLQKVHQNRTLKPRYARTQATPQAVRLDPEFDASKGDVFPGSVLTLKGNGVVTVCDGTTDPAGLCGSWIAPVYGIDEIRGNGGDQDMAMWVLGNDAIFEVHAPAFDASADWAGAMAKVAAGKTVELVSNAKGLLTVPDDTATAAEGEGTTTPTAPKPVVRLVGMEGTNVLLIAGLL